VTLRAPTRAVGAGLLIGALLTPPALRLESQLSGMHPAARLSIFLATGLLMLSVTIAACYFPSRRAAAIDPMTVPRAQ
jgi:ABC-type antimicrobial peptide transport system permease subunit